ncbi:hypothetical protein ACTFIZ_004679 [Dictyostelium cf. discoideum]
MDYNSISKICIEKNINIKELILKKLNLNINYEIKSLKDIEFLQLRFSSIFPFCNYGLTNGTGSIEFEDILRDLIYNNFGSFCFGLNTIFGCLLYELGVECKLIHILVKQVDVKNFNPFYTYHMFNNIKWKNSKEYIVDVSPFLMTCFKPIEIGNEIGVPSNCGPNSLFRCIKSNKDNSFFYQEKFQNSNEYISHFQFFKDDIITMEKRKIYFPLFTKISTFRAMKKFENGIYSLNKKELKVIYYNGRIEKIPITDQFFFKSVLLKYFKINLQFKSKL